MSKAVVFKNSNLKPSKNLSKNQKLFLVFALIITLTPLLWLVLSLNKEKPTLKPVENNKNTSGVVVARPTEEQIKQAKENLSESGSIVSVDTKSKNIVLKTDDAQQLEFIYNDESTVRKGVASLDVKFTDLKPGLAVNISYKETASGKMINNIWYMQ